MTDRTALAVYCQTCSRWVAVKEKLSTTPMLLKTPGGYVQQSPWLTGCQQADGTDGALDGRGGTDPGCGGVRSATGWVQGGEDRVTRVETGVVGGCPGDNQQG